MTERLRADRLESRDFHVLRRMHNDPQMEKAGGVLERNVIRGGRLHVLYRFRGSIAARYG